MLFLFNSMFLLSGRGKSPMKKALKGRSSYPTPKNILDSEISADDGDESDMEWEDVAGNLSYMFFSAI